MSSKIINILYTGISVDEEILNPLSSSEGINFQHFPTISISESVLSKDDLNRIENASKYDYLIFTSANGVKYFLKYYEGDYSTLSCTTKIVAIGNKTASLLLSNSIDVDLIPSNSSSKSIDELLTENLVNGKSILIPGSKISKADLFNSLESKGAMVDFVAIYENGIPADISAETLSAIEIENVDLLIFTSPSTFYNFISIFKIENITEFFSKKEIAVIGLVTKKAIESENVAVNIMPQEFNLNSLINEIVNYYK